MGALSFSYDIKPWRCLIRSLKYQHHSATEYGLSFQRYAALFDASIFNSPVAITKVATGLSVHSDIEELFADKKVVPAEEIDASFDIHAELRDTDTIPASSRWLNDVDFNTICDQLAHMQIAENFATYYYRFLLRDKAYHHATTMMLDIPMSDGGDGRTIDQWFDRIEVNSDNIYDIILPHVFFVYAPHTITIFPPKIWLLEKHHHLEAHDDICAAPPYSYKTLNWNRDAMTNAALFRPVPFIENILAKLGDEYRTNIFDNYYASKNLGGNITNLFEQPGIFKDVNHGLYEQILFGTKDGGQALKNDIAEIKVINAETQRSHEETLATPHKDGYINVIPQIFGDKNNAGFTVFQTCIAKKVFASLHRFVPVLAQSYPYSKPINVIYQMFGRITDYPYGIFIEDNLQGKEIKSSVNLIPQLFGKPYGKQFRVLENVLANVEDKMFRVIAQTVGTPERKEFRIWENINTNGETLNNGLNIFEQLNTESQQKVNNVFQSLTVQSEYKSLAGFSILAAIGTGQYGHTSNDNTNADANDTNGYIDTRIGHATVIDSQGYLSEQISGSLYSKAFQLMELLQAQGVGKHFRILDNVFAKTYGKHFDVGDFIGALSQPKNLFILQNITGKNTFKYGQSFDGAFGSWKDDFQFNIIDLILASKDNKLGQVYEFVYGAAKDNQLLAILHNDFANQNSQIFSIFNMFNHELMNVVNSAVTMNPNAYEQVTATMIDGNRPLSTPEYSLEADKVDVDHSIYTTDGFAHKTERDHSVYHTEGFAHKTERDYSVYHTKGFVHKTERDYSIYHTDCFGKKENGGYSVLDTSVMAYKTLVDTNWYQNPFGAYKQDVVSNVLEQPFFGHKQETLINTYDSVWLCRKSVTIATRNTYMLKRLQHEMWTTHQQWGQRIPKSIFQSTEAHAHALSQNIATHNAYMARKLQSTVERLQTGIHGSKLNNVLQRFQSVSLDGMPKSTIRYNDIVSLKSINKDIHQYYQISLDIHQEQVNRYYWLNVTKGDSLKLRRFHTPLSAVKKVKTIMQDDILLLNKYSHLLDVLECIFMGIRDKEVVMYDNFFVDVIHEGQPENGTKHINLFDEIFLTYPNDKFSIYHQASYDSFNTMVYKLGNSLQFWEQVCFATKEHFNLYLHLQHTSLQKIKHVLNIRDELCTSREVYDLNLDLSELWACRDSNNMLIMPWSDFAIKDRYSMDVYRQTHIYKDRHGIPSTMDIESIMKGVASVILLGDYGKTTWENINGAFIPVAKNHDQGFIDHITSVVRSASPGALFITENLFTSVLRHPTNLNIDIFLDKIPFKTWIEYENETITRTILHSAIYDDILSVKLPKTNGDTAVWSFDVGDVYKLGHPTDVITQIFMERSNQIATYTPSTEWVDKKNRSLFNEDTYISTQRIDRISDYFNQIYLERTPRLCYYDYGYGEWTHRTLYPILLDVKEEWGTRKDRDNKLFDFMTPGIRKNVPTFYDEYVIPGNVIRTSEIANQLDWMKKTNAKCAIHPHDFGNWAWVYETPDPFQQNLFGIDELLIPENDARYENFEDIIFDKKHLRPRNPVRIIDDTTFVAKFPSKHPIKKFQDIGLDYEAGAIKLQNYFGVETDVMHSMFLRFYRIWQAKVFQFATMTMQQAVNQMLEYLFAWIPDYYPVDKVEQAYRVFKMIRWYGEAAIIRNSQYIVSYELDTLQTTMKNGHCEIPHNLQCENPTSSNNTMFVDASLLVIRNDPTMLGSDAYVEFYIDNPQNTTISFSLMNTIGSVYIYLNDNLIDIQSHSTLNLVYSIPFTGDINTIKIEKPAAHNLNDTFYIGNIRVEKMSYKNLTIEFDPQLKAGNKPLNEIAIKLVQYANLKEDRDRAYKEALKSNLGLSEMYKKLLEYWNLHHQNKTKGKRLTIKEI